MTPIRLIGLLAAVLTATACGTPEPQFSGNAYSRLHADFLPPGSHRLVQVVDLATRERTKTFMIGTNPPISTYDSLIAAGIPDGEITDGSVAAAIAVCCGGGITQESIVMLYAPPQVSVAAGNIVEVRVGESQDLGARARPNTAVHVRAAEDGQGGCNWVPDDPGLHGRVLHCTGIEAEGWIRKTDYLNMWMLPPG